MAHGKMAWSAVLILTLSSVLHAAMQAVSSKSNWIGSWASAQQIPEPQNSLSPDELRDATLRQIVRLSAGGAALRVRLSNVFGTAPLHFTSVHVARPLSPSSARIDPSTDKAVTFSGSLDVIVPAGTDYVSDPVEFRAEPLSSLAISLHLDLPPAQQTGHPGSRATSYLVHGNQVSAADLPDAKTFDHWYLLSGVDVVAPPGAFSIVALGNSITDGHGATTNGNDRWTDVLAERLHASFGRKAPGVLNEGIGGNHILTDGLGPNALARFNRNVLAQVGVRYVMILEAVNDLGGLTINGEVPQAEHEALVHRLLGAYEQMALRAHAHGIKVIGCTITPYTGSGYYHPGPANETDRQEINKWIRAPGHFDAVVDFDRALRDPAHPERLLPKYDCGDHLHPSPDGYRAMADSIKMSLFAH